jgi:hypothetical protein
MNSLVQVNLVALAKAQNMAWHDMIQVDNRELFEHHIIHFETYAEDSGQSTAVNHFTRLQTVMLLHQFDLRAVANY